MKEFTVTDVTTVDENAVDLDQTLALPVVSNEELIAPKYRVLHAFTCLLLGGRNFTFPALANSKHMR
jgi:hypothetical protein